MANIGLQAEPRSDQDRRRPQSNTGSLGSILFGVVWGAVLVFAAMYANENYDALTRNAQDDLAPTPIFWILAGTVALSVLAVFVMLMAGIIKFLTGRSSSGRWFVLLGLLIGVALGTHANRLTEFTGRSASDRSLQRPSSE
ncbi:hypothetical protein [Halovulum sp. GXIMD14793]